jgi:hypothetical protein
MAIFNNHVSLHDGMIRWEKTRWVCIFWVCIPMMMGGAGGWQKMNMKLRGDKTCLTKMGLKRFNHGTLWGLQ